MAKIFISHASEDKESVANPLADLLVQRGLAVWLDQWELTLGDSLRRSIEQALSEASFGVVIVSPQYMRKLWPLRELDGLFSMETADRKLILPVLHNIRHDEITRRWPMLSDRLNCSTDRGLAVVADQIAAAIHKSTSEGAIQQPPEAVLANYRRRLLLAANRHDLRGLLYELEDFLRQYPAHPRARVLKDEISTAMRYEDSRFDPVFRMDQRRSASRFTILPFIFALLGLGSIILIIYSLLRWLFGW